MDNSASLVEMRKYGRDLAGAVKTKAIRDVDVMWHLKDLASKICYEGCRDTQIQDAAEVYRQRISELFT